MFRQLALEGSINRSNFAARSEQVMARRFWAHDKILRSADFPICCIAELHSARSENLGGTGLTNGWRIANPRYSRMQSCATRRRILSCTQAILHAVIDAGLVLERLLSLAGTPHETYCQDDTTEPHDAAPIHRSDAGDDRRHGGRARAFARPEPEQQTEHRVHRLRWPRQCQHGRTDRPAGAPSPEKQKARVRHRRPGGAAPRRERHRALRRQPARTRFRLTALPAGQKVHGLAARFRSAE